MCVCYSVEVCNAASYNIIRGFYHILHYNQYYPVITVSISSSPCGRCDFVFHGILSSTPASAHVGGSFVE